MKNLVNTKKAYIVTVTVKNGPFSSQITANQSRKVLASRGISTSAAKKISKGYVFTSIVRYKCPSVAIREKVKNQVYTFAKSSGMPLSFVKITSKVV